MNTAVYIRYELLRAFRNTRFFIISLVVPAAAVPPDRRTEPPRAARRHPVRHLLHGGHDQLGGDGRRDRRRRPHRGRRAVGWHRQMRVTPLPVRTYFEAKVLTGYLMAGVTIVAVGPRRLSLGVRLSVADWVTMTVLILIGLIPFAVLGILVGHLVTVDSMGPAIGGLTALFALLGGAWGPIVAAECLLRFAEALPSYWLVQAGKAAVGGEGWPATACGSSSPPGRWRSPRSPCACTGATWSGYDTGAYLRPRPHGSRSRGASRAVGCGLERS